MSVVREPSPEEVGAAMAYVNWAIGPRKRDIERDRLLESVWTAFFHGYGVTHVVRPQLRIKLIADEFAKPESFRAYPVREVHGPFDITVQCVASARGADKSEPICWDAVPSCQGHRVSLSVYERPCVDT